MRIDAGRDKVLFIRAGEDPENPACNCVEEYGEFIFQQPELTIEEISGEDVEQAVRSQKETAGGMGQ